MFRNGFRFQKNFILGKVRSKCFSESYGNIVKFSNNLKNKELKIPFEENTFSIYFNNDDKVSTIVEKVVGSHEKIEKCQVLNYEEEGEINIEETFASLIKQPFMMKINGHSTVKYFPSFNLLIANKLPENMQKKDDSFILNNYNFLMFKTLKEGTNLTEKLDKDLTALLEKYKRLDDDYTEAENTIEDRYRKRLKLYINLGILFFVMHTVTFYVLIYHIFGWDEVEPATYLVGNLYWIIGLSYFVFKKKRLDFSFLFSHSFKSEFFSQQNKLLGFSSVERQFVQREILEIQRLREVLKEKV